MGIVNRTKDASEQWYDLSLVKHNDSLNASTFPVSAQVPNPGTLQKVTISCDGISGAPTGILSIARFITGSGVTFIPLGSTFLIPAVGVSGQLSVSLPASGSSLLNVLANDQYYIIHGGGTGAASKTLSVSITVKPLQDIKTWHGTTAS